MKSLRLWAAILALLVAPSSQVLAQATLLPPGEQCFQAVSGLNGTLGALGAITGGAGGSSGAYGGISLTGGSGTGATANVTVSGGAVTSVSVLNPGTQFVTGDVLSAASGSIGGVTGFSVPVLSTSINSSLAGGSVSYLIPNTQTAKQTWQDAGETTLNQNPVPLDQNGCATVYGAGVYLQVLKDSLGNTVWSKLTASTSPVGIFWAGLAGGTGNAITITDTAFALQDGATIQFLAKAANTGPATTSVSGGAQIAIIEDTSTGPAALSGGEIGPGNTPLITYDAANAEFHLVNPAVSTSGGGGGTSSNLTPPQGYLNLVGQASGDVIQTADAIGVSTIFYSPFVGSTLPVWNGSTFKIVVFSELTATLTVGGSPSGTIQDECVFSNNGVPTLVTAPSWTSVAAGASNRGTGAGTAQIVRLQGIWVNAVSIVAYNGLSSYTIPANQCTYVGSISVDASAGQVSAYRSYGTSRKFGVWNAYNRQPIYLKAGDSNTGWNPGATLGPVQGLTGNSLQIFTGLQEEISDLKFFEKGIITSGGTGVNVFLISAIGFNSTVAAAGFVASSSLDITGSISGYTAGVNNTAALSVTPLLGINVFTALEQGAGATVSGGEVNNVLTAYWRG